MLVHCFSGPCIHPWQYLSCVMKDTELVSYSRPAPRCRSGFGERAVPRLIPLAHRPASDSWFREREQSLSSRPDQYPLGASSYVSCQHLNRPIPTDPYRHVSMVT